ncbi:MAG: penicillin acylase family protein [Pseudomonadales bacterium]|jgi:penicillin amidase|nr:penicillin acylase family protein [Pseudomonadales bacterium]MDP6472802.1 penicillin acylase family protein [Pseudomonadales bacterium]MDP6828018.1 penicillin acylase family protein [Pseudomonadales bacterium]MDP6970582.1 penicillin acylase family protein [Pseudomonadales bacterium]
MSAASHKPEATMQHRIADADAPFEIVWDDIGVAHVFASTVADAYRGMGYAAGSERLWQIHLSTAYANGEAAALLGERFLRQDAIQRACNVHGGNTAPLAGPGDWIADAYLDGLNAAVDALDDIPPEFLHAGAEPKHFTRADIAARYRFTCWFQHKSWTEKMVLGRLMATHGTDWFRNHILHLNGADEVLIDELTPALRALDPAPLSLAYPDVDAASFSGSNNWTVVGKHSASGAPILATDPHQPHSIPNAFFFVHLHAPLPGGDWDTFGAAFPGVPYFMMGYTRDLAWGLTTGFVDCYDVYIEEIRDGMYRSAEGWCPVERHTERIAIKGGTHQDIVVQRTHHGPLLEPLTSQLSMSEATQKQFATSLFWSLTDIPVSAGALARLPLATSAAEFGDRLFEDDVCPLVNNIICVDRDNGLRRFIAATLPVRTGASGSVPLPGWRPEYDFDLSTAAQLTVETDPECGYALTANNDTMGERGEFYIHNFPTHNARAERIRQMLESGAPFSVRDFETMQLDLTDLRAERILPDLLDVLRRSEDELIRRAVRILESWDRRATEDGIAPCLYYPFLDRFWPRRFMNAVLDDPLINALPLGAPGINRLDVEHFSNAGSPWLDHRVELETAICATMRGVVEDVIAHLGDDPDLWRWGALHQIRFEHRLSGQDTWNHMRAGPDPIGGSGTTLGMAMHMGPGPGDARREEIPCRVYHGPAFRLVVDLADPDHARFVIAGGNGGRPDSPFIINQYRTWLEGRYYELRLRREELSTQVNWEVRPQTV